MAITIRATPSTLTWANFTVTANQILDPADGTLVDAYTSFNYNLPNLPPRKESGRLYFPDPWNITITPKAQVWTSVTKTAALLSHEQWHYDVGIVTGRALVRRLASASGATMGEMLSILNEAVTLHFHTRAGILQKRYDKDTRHGTNAYYQKIWKDRMTQCLANPKADQIGGFWL